MVEEVIEKGEIVKQLTTVFQVVLKPSSASKVVTLHDSTYLDPQMGMLGKDLDDGSGQTATHTESRPLIRHEFRGKLLPLPCSDNR